MSGISYLKIINIENDFCELFYYQHNFQDGDLNEELLNNETIRNATLYVFLMSIALYSTNNHEAPIELIHYIDDAGELRKFNSCFYDEVEASKIIRSSELIEWNNNISWKEEMYNSTVNKEIQKLFSEHQTISELPRNYFFARIYFHSEKSLTGLKTGMNDSNCTLNTYVSEWL